MYKAHASVKINKIVARRSVRNREVLFFGGGVTNPQARRRPYKVQGSDSQQTPDP